MAIVAGDKLGPYEILAPIGAGGMGEVYSARDPRLNRDVAIKVSAERFAERFEREAHAVAALNHPNICSLYDVGPNYLVMELIEGPTLADRMKEGAVPLEEALGIAHQIAEALGAAHEKGITHRDLKPGNIKIRTDGMVKVLDFGLAKMGGTPTANTEDSPTISMAATQAGVILGTAAYMAPEQARGKPVDKRADIWAFGVVLYEMLTGKRLFKGEDMTDTLAAVLRKEPEWEHVPGKVRRLLKSCLEKDPKQRLCDIGDAWKLLDDDAPPQIVLAPSAKSRVPWAVAAAALGLVSIVLGVLHWRDTRPAEPKPLVRLDVDLGPDVAISSQNGASVILSPDGSRLVYVSQGKLFTRKLDQSKGTELAGTEGAFAPFFSPDAKWVAFFTSSQLKKVSLEGGTAVALCNASNPRGGSWGEDGNIVATLGNLSGLSLVPESGGAPVPLTEVAPGESSHRWPQILPGGKAVLFTTQGSGGRIEIVSLMDHHRKILLPGGVFGRYSPSGHLIYMNQGTLFAVPFDLNGLELRGTPAPVLDDVTYTRLYTSAQVDVSRMGTLVYRAGAGAGLVNVQWLDSTGKTQLLLAKPGNYLRPRLSLDGSRLALTVGDGSDRDLWVYDGQRDKMTRLTIGGTGTPNIFSVWSPDGRFIVFSAGGGISWIRADAGSQPQILTPGNERQNPYSFTPDGKRLAFGDSDPQTGPDIWTVPVESDGAGLHAGKPEPFLRTPSNETSPSFSPDGRWLAYASNESGAFQIYVKAFPDKGGKWTVSNSGGQYPVWSRTAHELMFRADDNQVMVATYTVQGDSFVPDTPRIWSEKRLADVGQNPNFDLAPDGKRIAALMPAPALEAQQPQNQVIFLMNFFDELRRKAPAGK